MVQKDQTLLAEIFSIFIYRDYMGLFRAMEVNHSLKLAETVQTIGKMVLILAVLIQEILMGMGVLQE